MKAKHGSDYDPDASDDDASSDSESAESEDEHGEELTPTVDAAILRTLARIRKRDPGIYDSNKDIFGGKLLSTSLKDDGDLLDKCRGEGKGFFETISPHEWPQK